MFSYWFKSPLLIATEDNDLVKVQQLLATATAESVNSAYGSKQITALEAACEQGRTDIALALLAHPEIDVNCKKSGKVSSPLAQAALNGHTGIVKLLLSRPEIDISEPYALCFAAQMGYNEIVQALLACPNINVNFAGVDELTPLNVAARENHCEIVKALLACPGIDLKLVDYWGRAPLNNAAIMAHSDVVQLLLVHPDIEINAEDHLIAGTPLNGLLITNYDMPRGPVLPENILKTAKLLLGHPGVKIDLIYGAQEGGSSEDIVVEADEEAGAAVETSAAATRALLHNQLMAAVIVGDVDVVTSLLAQKEVEVNVLGVMDHTPLHWAAFFGHTEMVRVLLAQPGISLNGIDSDGRTPLALAAKHGHAETVKVLLEAPDVLVNAGALDTVHSVLIQGDQEFDESDTAVTDLVATLRVLLAHPKVDLSVLVVDKSNLVPLHAQFLAAVLCGETEKVEAFLARTDININVLSMDSHTALSWASYLGHVAIVQALVAHPKIDLQPNNASGPLRSAIEFAIRYDHIEIVKILLVRLDAASDQAAGHTIFYDCAVVSDAVAQGRVEIVQLLVARPDVRLELIKSHYPDRPTPARKLCEEMVRKAHAERLAQQAAVDVAQSGGKRRSWWEAFGLV